MKAVVFDLDNTLFDSEQYFSGAFKSISEYLAKKCRSNQSDIHDKLMKLWNEKTSMYPHLFEELLNSLGLENELENIIKIFNEYDGKLKPYQDVIPTLKELKKRNYKLGIVTDGNVERQKRKIKSLGFADFFDIIVFTKELNNPKPSEIPFQEVINKLEVSPQKSFYVGDNPLIDFEGAKKVGLKTIRILIGEFKGLPRNEYIDYEINNLKELLNIVGSEK